MNLPAGVDASPRSLRWEIFAFCAWLVLLPLPLGSNRPWAMALTLPPLFALAAWLALRDRAALRESLAATLLRWPGVCLLAFLAVVQPATLSRSGLEKLYSSSAMRSPAVERVFSSSFSSGVK